MRGRSAPETVSNPESILAHQLEQSGPKSMTGAAAGFSAGRVDWFHDHDHDPH